MATTTIWTKTGFEEEAAVSVTDKFWGNWNRLLQGRESKDEMFEAVVEAAAAAAAAAAELATLQAEINCLPQNPDKSTQYLVMSASTVAKDEKLRDEFREKQVGEQLCLGGFIAHEFYLDFVMSAREFKKKQQEKEKEEETVKAVNNLGKVLLKARRKNHSMLTTDYMDEEGPQSAVASELLQLAINSLQTTDLNDVTRLRVTHQQQLVTAIRPKEGSSQSYKVIRKRTADEKKKNSEAETEDKKSDDRIDICVWFVNEEDSLGACVLAAVEYKPTNSSEKERQAQADIYGSNINILHKKPCIVIDIAGGCRLDNWEVSAYGLVRAEFSNQSYTYEKTPLFSGSGAKAIVLVARGLVAARANFPKALSDYGTRLGPVVGVINDHVYKAYDNAKFRNPNFPVIQDLLDSDAELLESRDKKLKIVKMMKRANDWKGEEVVSDVFAEIIAKLKRLHASHGPHGDIRLSNLLSSGFIIDFDFVGATFYPATLQSLTQDGQRHPEVEAMIKNEESKPLQPKKFHDWFSLGQVMILFKAVDDVNQTNWKNCCQRVEDQTLPDQKIPKFLIKLINNDIPLRGTGHTPEKKQPTDKKQRT